MHKNSTVRKISNFIFITKIFFQDMFYDVAADGDFVTEKNFRGLVVKINPKLIGEEE